VLPAQNPIERLRWSPKSEGDGAFGGRAERVRGTAMKALIALDESEASWDAARFAAELLRAEDHVVVATVVDAGIGGGVVAAGGLTGLPASLPVTDDRSRLDRQARAVDDLRRRLQPAAARARADDVLVEFDGDVATRISELATELDVDLIIVGTRDRSVISRLFGGSVSRDLVAKSPCPVLVVR
jgi:nucleotide-binding universal stress UspA family protein